MISNKLGSVSSHKVYKTLNQIQLTNQELTIVKENILTPKVRNMVSDGLIRVYNEERKKNKKKKRFWFF